MSFLFSIFLIFNTNTHAQNVKWYNDLNKCYIDLLQMTVDINPKDISIPNLKSQRLSATISSEKPRGLWVLLDDGPYFISHAQAPSLFSNSKTNSKPNSKPNAFHIVGPTKSTYLIPYEDMKNLIQVVTVHSDQSALQSMSNQYEVHELPMSPRYNDEIKKLIIQQIESSLKEVASPPPIYVPPSYPLKELIPPGERNPTVFYPTKEFGATDRDAKMELEQKAMYDENKLNISKLELCLKNLRTEFSNQPIIQKVQDKINELEQGASRHEIPMFPRSPGSQI